MHADSNSQVLLVQCQDKPGLVYTITGALFRLGVNITGNQEFVDGPTQTFYMRTEFCGAVPVDQLLADLRRDLPVGAELKYSTLEPKKIVVLGSKEHHCLADILIRHTFQEFNARVLAVIANHPDLATLVEKFEVPFHLISCHSRSSAEQEQLVLKAVDSLAPDYIVLAKYMRILSPQFCDRYAGRIVNIHHSFLPAFVGARPYEQAFQRGVKVIGATAHFVTSELDKIAAQSLSRKFCRWTTAPPPRTCGSPAATWNKPPWPARLNCSLKTASCSAPIAQSSSPELHRLWRLLSEPRLTPRLSAEPKFRTGSDFILAPFGIYCRVMHYNHERFGNLSDE